jgi:hypothetical protein
LAGQFCLAVDFLADPGIERGNTGFHTSSGDGSPTKLARITLSVRVGDIINAK